MKPPDKSPLKSMIMDETTDHVIQNVAVDKIDLGPYVIELCSPAKPEVLLDLPEVAAAYEKDEYMPYWATLWPVAKRMATLIAMMKWGPGLTAIELGCGLGLPGVAALKAGMEVTFTDYDKTALKFAEMTALRNGGGKYTLLAMDWREPSKVQYDVVLASDLTYERRNVEPLVESFKTLLKPGGLAMVADQNRAFQDNFVKALKAAGFVYIVEKFTVDGPKGVKVDGTLYLVRWGDGALTT